MEGREGCICHFPWTHTPKWLKIFPWNLNHTHKTSLETFWHPQVWNLKYLSLTTVLFFFTFCCYFRPLQKYFLLTKKFLISGIVGKRSHPPPFTFHSHVFDHHVGFFKIQQVYVVSQFEIVKCEIWLNWGSISLFQTFSNPLSKSHFSNTKINFFVTPPNPELLRALKRSNLNRINFYNYCQYRL